MVKYNLDELKANYKKVCKKLTEEELRLLTNLQDYNILKARKEAKKELIETIRQHCINNGDLLDEDRLRKYKSIWIQ